MSEFWKQHGEAIQVFYSMALAHMAGVDGEFSAEEKRSLVAMLEDYGLGEKAQQSVLNAVNMTRQWLDVVLSQLAGLGVGPSLLLDICCMAHADGVVKGEELETIARVARTMSISNEQAVFVEALAGLLYRAASDGDLTPVHRHLAGTKSVGLPDEAFHASLFLERCIHPAP
jgi:uncharacterized tellurite resistance protein B-like protein